MSPALHDWDLNRVFQAVSAGQGWPGRGIGAKGGPCCPTREAYSKTSKGALMR
jgi:hypothetical protein